MEKDTVVIVDRFTSFGFGVLYMDRLAEALDGRGYQVRRINLAGTDAKNNVAEAIRDRDRIAFGLSIPYGFFDVDGRPFPERLGVPMAICLVDHPAYKMGWTPFSHPLAITGCTDPTHVDFLTRKGIASKAFHLPHFDVLPANLKAEGERPPPTKRKGLFFAGCPEIMGRAWSMALDAPEQVDVIDTLRQRGIDLVPVLNAAVTDESRPLDVSVDEVLSTAGVRAGLNLQPEQYAELLTICDVIVRSIRRAKIVDALSDCALTVMGPGWKDAPGVRRSKIRIRNAKPYLECEAERAKALVTLDISHGQPFANHDRIIHAARIGQPVLALNRPFFETGDKPANVVTADLASIKAEADALMGDRSRVDALGPQGRAQWETGAWSPAGALERILRQFALAGVPLLDG